MVITRISDREVLDLLAAELTIRGVDCILCHGGHKGGDLSLRTAAGITCARPEQDYPFFRDTYAYDDETDNWRAENYHSPAVLAQAVAAREAYLITKYNHVFGEEEW